MTRLFAFSGRMFVGKDFVAKMAKLPIRGFADPIYALSRHYCGTDDKSVPGVRRFMQEVGQWGWGKVDADYPHSPARAAITQQIRDSGRRMADQFSFVDWTEYGCRQDFWVNILLMRLGLRTCPAAEHNEHIQFPEKQLLDGEGHLVVAITNARFEHELNPVRETGFEHYHVLCSPDTRAERMAASGYKPKCTEEHDTSEAMAARLDVEMPDERVIWNDHRLAPETKNYMTLDQFLDKIDPRNLAKRHETDAEMAAAQI